MTPIKTTTAGALFLFLATMLPSAHANSDPLTPMLGTWHCTAETAIPIPATKDADTGQSGGSSIKMVETYTATTTADGMSVGESSAIFYLPVHADASLPIEVSSQSKAHYRLDGDTLELKVIEWELNQGRIYPKEKASAFKKIFSDQMPASVRSQFSAKAERTAEDFADAVAKSFQDRIGKKIKMPFSLKSTGAGKMQKTFGSGSTAVVHDCTQRSK